LGLYKENKFLFVRKSQSYFENLVIKAKSGFLCLPRNN
jgi:hypothetical protein